MYVLLKYLLILNIFQFSQSCEPYYKYVERDIDEASSARYPWLVVIRNVRDKIFRLSYGSLIHPKAVLTSSLGIVGHTKDDIVVETNCEDTDLIGVLKNCTIRSVAQIIHQSDPEDLHNIDNTYDVLILQTSFDLTDRIQPINLASNTDVFLKTKCLYTRWMREYSKSTKRKGVVTVAYHTTFNDEKLDDKSLDYNQLIFDKDWLISRSYHLPFFNATDKHLLNFVGGPLVCKVKQQSLERYIQVAIANFRITVYSKHFFDADIIVRGTLLNTIPLYNDIIRTVNENI